MNTGCLQRTFKYTCLSRCVCIYIQIAVYVYFTNLLNCAYGALCVHFYGISFVGASIAAVAVVCCAVVMQLQIAQNQMAKLTVTINCFKFLLMADRIQVKHFFVASWPNI